MKKIININFQGRVVPIEEPAYEILKQYVESLKTFFAHEDGREEIINDIESRIAELFHDRLKRGAACIVEEDVESVIAGIGRPEELEAAEAEDTPKSEPRGRQQAQVPPPPPRGRFVRNADDKILGGVCSGLAAYLGIDPVIVRILFVILGGGLFWIYILLWIIVPSQSIRTSVTKRLYRNPDEKVIAGVCGGLAAYFRVEAWVPRLIFALPLIIGAASGGFHALMWDWDWGIGPRIFTGSIGSTLFIAYIILWIAVPYATSAAEKLEMRGEKVDLNSIRDTIKDDLEGFKARAEGWGKEVHESARNLTGRAREFSSDPQFRQAGRGIGHIIGVLFRAFFLFIAGVVALGLFAALIGLLFGGLAIFPIKDFLLDGWEQNALAACAIVLTLAVPLIALITFLIRRIAGVRSRNHYIGSIFGGLWFIGIICAVILGAILVKDFRSRSGQEEARAISQPTSGKLYVALNDDFRSRQTHYHREWFGNWDDDGMPIYGLNRDSLLLNTVRVDIAKSSDSLYHLYTVKFSRSNTVDQAKLLASRINFDISQMDSLLTLPRGFTISSKDKFRNQQVLVVIEVPVGKKIEIDQSIDDYDWFNVNVNKRRNIKVEWNEWEYTDDYRTGKEYIMTPSGLERTDKTRDIDENEYTDPVQGEDSTTVM